SARETTDKLSEDSRDSRGIFAKPGRDNQECLLGRS
ncbi:hypothetical protein HKBW3S44_01710, partial [Candidatus Hakubella thermalkaliphila]